MKYWFVRSPFKTRKWEDVLMTGVFNLYGIRGNAAKKNISEMQKGDMAFWYSSSAGKKIYGIMKVKNNAISDNTADTDWLAIDFIPKTSLSIPIPIKTISEIELFSDSRILKQKRISVVEISKNEYDAIVKIGEN